MKSFKGMTKSLVDASIDGVTLFGAKKGYAVVKTLAKKVLPATMDANVSGLIVAGVVAVGADMIMPARFSRLVGAVAAAEVISGFVSPIIDPMLVKAGVLDTISVPVPVAALPGATAGYAQRMGGTSFAAERGMAGYATARGMGGYTPNMGNQAMIFPAVNAAGLPG